MCRCSHIRYNCSHRVIFLRFVCLYSFRYNPTFTEISDKGIEWESLTTLKVKNNKFDRKVQEALGIQYHECEPKKGGMNLDDGQYVNTKFWTPYFKYLRKRQNDANNADIATAPVDDDITLYSDG